MLGPGTVKYDLIFFKTYSGGNMLGLETHVMTKADGRSVVTVVLPVGCTADIDHSYFVDRPKEEQFDLERREIYRFHVKQGSYVPER